MLRIKGIDHVGIRVRDAKRSERFYGILGFRPICSGDFARHDPVILKHQQAGVVINLLGPANQPDGPNVLQDLPAKHAGYTHMALTVNSITHGRVSGWARDSSRGPRGLRGYPGHIRSRSGSECN